MSSTLSQEAHAFREGFYKELADKKQPLLATVSARFASADLTTNENREYYFHRYRQEVRELDRVYGRNKHVENQYLIGFGQNDDGQLGVEISRSGTINEIKKFSNCRVLDVGGCSSAVINDGRTYVWGMIMPVNENNQAPKPMRGFPAKDDMKIVDVGVGDGHAIFLGMSGDVYSWGFYKDEDSGEFRDTGDCVKQGADTLLKVERLRKPAVKVFANVSMSAAILEDGSLVTWGMSNTGSLARTAGMCRPDAQGKYDISNNFYKVVDDNGKGYDMEIIREHFMTPKPVLWSSPSIKPIVESVAIGFAHILVTAFDLANNTGPLLYGAGSNAGGQLGTDDGVETHHELHPVRGELEGKPVASIAAGKDFSIAVTFEGKVYGFGSNDSGQLGLGYTGRETFPAPKSIRFKSTEPVVVVQVAAGSRFALALTDDGNVYSWGENNLSQTGHAINVDQRNREELDEYFPVLLDLSQKFNRNVKVVSVSAGQDHAMVIAEDVIQ